MNSTPKKSRENRFLCHFHGLYSQVDGFLSSLSTWNDLFVADMEKNARIIMEEIRLCVSRAEGRVNHTEYSRELKRKVSYESPTLFEYLSCLVFPCSFRCLLLFWLASVHLISLFFICVSVLVPGWVNGLGLGIMLQAIDRHIQTLLSERAYDLLFEVDMLRKRKTEMEVCYFVLSQYHACFDKL